MVRLRNPYVIIPIIASTIVGVMLPPGIVDRHGIGRTLFFTVLAISVIWFWFFVISHVINSIVSDELKKKEEENKRDFV